MKQQLRTSFEYQWNDKLIRYREQIQTDVHIPAGFEINPSDYNDGGKYRFIVHCCCFNKGHRMCIGLQRKSRYKIEYNGINPRNSSSADVLVTAAGANCESDDEYYVTVGDTMRTRSGKIGTIRYVGPVHFARGIWIGLEFHEHFGPHDGTARNVRYYTCPPKRGIMVKQISDVDGHPVRAIGTAIHQNGHLVRGPSVIGHPIAPELPSWTVGDWISIMLTIQGSCTEVQFFFNGELLEIEDAALIVIETETEESDPLVLHALVDEDDHMWYIEQAFTTDMLMQGKRTTH